MHPDISPDMTLGKAAGSRRRTTISQPRPLVSLPPAEVRDTNVSSAIPSVADDLQRVNSEPVMMQNLEDGCGVEHFDAIYRSAVIPSTGELVPLVNDVSISIRGGQPWFASPFYTRYTAYDF